MSEQDFDSDDELRRQLRALDPARTLPPADADALASLMEDTMSEPTNTPGENRRRNGLWIGAAVVGVAAAATVGVVIGTNGGDDKPDKAPVAKHSLTIQTVTPLSAGKAPAAKCMLPSADVVAQQPVAIEGTVVSIKDGLVTLKPSHFYAGKETDLVTVTAPDLQMTEMPVDFQVGQDYIVGATDGRVSICGLSGLASDDLKALYEKAYGK